VQVRPRAAGVAGRLMWARGVQRANSLFKAELVRNRGPWKYRRHGEVGLVPPVEYETTHRSTTLPEQPAQRKFEASSQTRYLTPCRRLP